MKRLSIALVLLLIAVTAFAGETITRGAAISRDAKSVALNDVLTNPDAYTKDAVVVAGTDTQNCERKGCWMQLSAGEGKQSVRVTFKDYAFFVPLDSKGICESAG